MGCALEKYQACRQAIADWQERRRLAEEARRARERQRMIDVITDMHTRNRTPAEREQYFAARWGRTEIESATQPATRPASRQASQQATQQATRQATRQATQQAAPEEPRRKRDSVVTWEIPKSIRGGRKSPSSSTFNVSNLDQVSAGRHSGSDSSGAVGGELDWTYKVLCYPDFKLPRPKVRLFQEEAEGYYYVMESEDIGVKWEYARK